MDLTSRAHKLVAEHFSDKEKNLAVDATCGNGFDSEFLARLGFKHVFGFDVQKRAITICQNRMSAAGFNNAHFIQDSHEHLGQHIQLPIDCAMFNFGYLPNADQKITTTSQSSLVAVTVTLSALSEHGLMTLLCYPGHPNGAIETKVIQKWLRSLHPAQMVETHLAKSPKPNAPILYTVTHA